jgi:3-phosphoshikimate 1-carboxyvinyltransferase
VRSDSLPIPLCEGPLDAVVSPPGSKSITNRCLLMAALADGESRLERALESEDTVIFAECLRRLGIPVEEDRANAVIRVHGQGGRVSDRGAELWVGNAGTAARFITALLVFGRGEYALDGVAAMRQRPMRDLLVVLEGLGARFTWGAAPYHFPFTMRGAGALPGGAIEISAAKTSQHTTGLLLVAPYATGDVALRLTGEVVSQPYLDMTCRLMTEWGARVERPVTTGAATGAATYVVRAGAPYAARTHVVEPDASSASYLFAAAAAVGGRVRVRHLSGASAQGDVRFVDVLGQMGCEVEKGDDFVEVRRSGPLHGVEVDMNDISDTAPTLAALAPLADGPVVIRNVEHMRWKETDRVAAVATELRRLGAVVEELRDGLAIQPGLLRPAEIETYGDHRIAMAFAITGLRSPGVVIRDPGCVAKTFPTFFEELFRITGATPRG